MKSNILLGISLVALCCSISCSSSSDCSKWSGTDEATCTSYTDPSGIACGWYNNVCGTESSPADPIPQTVACSDVTDATTCNAHSVAGVPCYWEASATTPGCVAVKDCTSISDEADCTAINTLDNGTGLVQGGCQWSTTCIANPTLNCSVNDCDQYTAWSDKSDACNAAMVNGQQACSWSNDTFFGGTCSQVIAGGDNDPCKAGTATTCGTDPYSFCSWH